MNCRQIQSSFYDYADDTLDQSVRSVIESHLSDCTACRIHYETQCSLHHDIMNAVASELTDLHFHPQTMNAEPPRASARPSLSELIRQTAYVVPALLLLGVILWPLMQPSRERIDDPAQSSYAEAFQYFEMRSADRLGASNLIIPVAVIIQPGIPTRVIELDGTTDISAELK